MAAIMNDQLKKSKNLDQHTKGPLNMALLCVSLFTGLILLAFSAEKSVGLTIIRTYRLNVYNRTNFNHRSLPS